MPDVFSTSSQPGEGWDLDGAVIDIEGGDSLLVQSINIQYTRPTKVLTPLNRRKSFIVAGRPRGSVNISVIIGPTAQINSFLQKFADVCNTAKNTITMRPAGDNGCGGGGSSTRFICKGVLLEAISVTSQDAGEGGISQVNGSFGMKIQGLDVR